MDRSVNQRGNLRRVGLSRILPETIPCIYINSRWVALFLQAALFGVHGYQRAAACVKTTILGAP
jgi:hypothetical protein